MFSILEVRTQFLKIFLVEGPLACPCREEMLELGPELLSGKDRGELRAVPRGGVLLNQAMFTKYYRTVLKKCTCSVLCASGVHRLRKIAKALAPAVLSALTGRKFFDTSSTRMGFSQKANRG